MWIHPRLRSGKDKLLLDSKHLSDFAMGNPALVQRFLSLFLANAQSDLQRMRDASIEDFHKAVHSLKSSASSIGAWQLVAYVEDIMEMEQRALLGCREHIIAELSMRLDDVLNHIREILKDG